MIIIENEGMLKKLNLALIYTFVWGGDVKDGFRLSFITWQLWAFGM